MCTPPLTLQYAIELMSEHGVLREVMHTADDDEQTDQAIETSFIESLSCDPGDARSGVLLFLPQVTHADDEIRPTCYVSEHRQPSHVHAPGLIVNDMASAMGILCSALHGNPQRRLTLVGVYGTSPSLCESSVTSIRNMLQRHGISADAASHSNPLNGGSPCSIKLRTVMELFDAMHDAVRGGSRTLVADLFSFASVLDALSSLTFDLSLIVPGTTPESDTIPDAMRTIIESSKALLIDGSHHFVSESCHIAYAQVPVIRYETHDDGTDHDLITDVTRAVETAGGIPPLS